MLTSRRIALALGAVCLSLAVSRFTGARGRTGDGHRQGRGSDRNAAPSDSGDHHDGTGRQGRQPGRLLLQGPAPLGALQLATGGNWSGPWNGEFKAVRDRTRSRVESHAFEATRSANYYWVVLAQRQVKQKRERCECGTANRRSSAVLSRLRRRSRVQPAPCRSASKRRASASVGETVSVTVSRYSASGRRFAGERRVSRVRRRRQRSPTRKVMRRWNSPHAGEMHGARQARPNSVRTEATICVHNGNDGTCGTPGLRPAPPAPRLRSVYGRKRGGQLQSSRHPYKGPYALVADVTGLIDGHVYRRGARTEDRSPARSSRTAPSSSVSLRAAPRVQGSLLRLRRDQGALPVRPLRRGQLLQGLQRRRASPTCCRPRWRPGATCSTSRPRDVAGNRTTLARGTSRIVFYVR